ncbi:ATP-binding protein [Nitrospira sp. Kam-Ns4a]
MAPPLRILLVDDDPQIRPLAIKILTQEFPEFRIEPIEDRRSLDEALDTSGVALVITDYQLSWATGLEVLRSVKARDPDCPVIMFTASGSEEIAVEAMKAGLDDYVLKSSRHLIRLPAAVRTALDAAAQRARLRDVEAHYRALFERLPVGIFRCAPSGAFLDANPALVELLGCPDRASLLRANVSDFHASPDTHPAWERLIESGEGLKGFELSLRRADSRIIWVNGKVQAVRDRDGRVLYLEGFFEDISDRKRIEAQAGHTARLAALGQLISAIAHQVRNPLFILTGYLQLLREKISAQAVARELQPDVEEAQEAARRITQIIEGFLKLAAPATHRKEPCSIAAIFREVVELLAFEWAANRIEVKIEAAPDLPAVEADPQELREVFLNLMHNASQAMATAHGGGTLRVVAAQRTGNAGTPAPPPHGEGEGWGGGAWVEVRIQDNGPGIPPEHRARLFEPFFTTKPAGQGTGLGLWTVQRIVMGLRGTVACESEPGRGATFIVRLPVAEEGTETR